MPVPQDAATNRDEPNAAMVNATLEQFKNKIARATNFFRGLSVVRGSDRAMLADSRLGNDMKAMIAALVGLLAFALPTASAQTWTFAGVNFEPRTGWCTSNVLDNGSPALKAQPCGVDYPYMTIGQVLPPSEGADVDLPAAAVKSADQAAGDEGKKLVAELVAKSYANCTRGTHSVERDPVDQVFGFTTFSVFNCPTAPGGTVTFRNFSGYAKTTGGAIWVVAFDYPLADLSVDDKAMLRSAVKAISASK